MCECAEYSRVRAWEKGNSRLSGEDSMAASGPSQAKHTAKESSGEEKRAGETGGEEKELRTLAKTGGGERRGGKERTEGEHERRKSDDRGNFDNRRRTVLQICKHGADTH